MIDDDQDDLELDDEQHAFVARLTVEEIAAIDSALLAHVTDRWRSLIESVGNLRRMRFSEVRKPTMPAVSDDRD
jgi:hypothetical protein